MWLSTVTSYLSLNVPFRKLIFLWLTNHLLIYWGRDKMAAILQTIFSNQFSCLKDTVLWYKFHWNLFSMVQSKISQHWFTSWLGAGQAPSHYLNHWWPSLLIHICITQLWWVNSLRPGDAIWRHRSGSTLAQVMACCLTAPRHYLIQCWLNISSVQWLSSKDNPTRDTLAINHWN